MVIPGERQQLDGRDEQGLLEALAAGDRSAAETLVERTYTTVYGLLCHLCRGDGARAADLTQEVYRRAWASLGRFEGRSAFGTWLCRIAYNAFYDETRRSREAPSDVDLLAATLPAADPAVDQDLIEGETVDRLRRAVSALPRDLRFSVMARFWGDCSVADIAREEGVTEMAIRKRLKRALGILSRALGEVGS